MRRLGTFLAALILSAQLGSSVASADTSNAQVIWTNPHPTGANDIIRIYRDLGTRKPVVPPSASKGVDPCSNIDPSIWAVDGNGVTVWILDLYTSWCYDGVNLTYHYHVGRSAVGGNWCDLGTITDSVSSPPTGYTQTDAYHKHHFAQCLPTPWGMQYWGDAYPWVSDTVYGNGGYTSGAGT